MPDANGNPTVEELQQQLRAVAQERDQYRAQSQQFQQQGNYQQPYVPQNAHILARLTGIDNADWGQVDQHYVPRAQYQQDMQRFQQEAVNRAYAMARGDLDVMFAIRDAQGQYKDLGNFESPLAKKTMELLQKDGYAQPRMVNGVPKQPSSWTDFVYERPDALSRVARVAQAELMLAEKETAAANATAQQAGTAAGIASGGAPASAAPAGNEQAWMDAAEKGDTGAIREMTAQHIASLTGQQV